VNDDCALSDWVVLLACNTGAGQCAGAEAVSGLGRAFFYAGTRALLVSNWPVETTSAKILTTALFQRQAADPALSRSEALNHTMIDLVDNLGSIWMPKGGWCSVMPTRSSGRLSAWWGMAGKKTVAADRIYTCLRML